MALKDGNTFKKNLFLYCRSYIFSCHVVNEGAKKGDYCIVWASSRENLSSGFPTKRASNQSLQLQRLARKLKFRS